MYDLKLWQQQKKSLHLTFEDLAEKTKISISTLKDIFRGATTNPRIETVAAIEKALEIIDGITQEQYNAGFRHYKNVNVTPLEDDLIYAFREIGEKFGIETQKAAITMLENMAGIKR